MNTKTDTPRTDEWETYCDECYYHLWRVRRKNERGFNDGYHVHNGEEAKSLVDLLNKQDSELAAVTEQRDRLAEVLLKCRKFMNEESVTLPFCVIDEALATVGVVIPRRRGRRKQ